MSKLLIPKLHSCTWKHGDIKAPLAALHKNSRWWQVGRGSSNWQFGAFSQPDVHMKLSSHVFSDRVGGHRSFQEIVFNTSQCTLHDGSPSGVALGPRKIPVYLLVDEERQDPLISNLPSSTNLPTSWLRHWFRKVWERSETSDGMAVLLLC